VPGVASGPSRTEPQRLIESSMARAKSPLAFLADPDWLRHQ
jgi:hypothetical protein